MSYLTILLYQNFVVIEKLLLAMFLGLLLGAERTKSGKVAGMRTYSLVTFGSCLLTVIASIIGESYAIAGGDHGVINPSLTVMAGIISGIGFLGAGLIIFQGNRLSGLTTAADLWVAMAIGVTVGYGFFAVAIFATLLTFFILYVLWFVERYVKENLMND